MAILLAINKTISCRINMPHNARPLNIRPVVDTRSCLFVWHCRRLSGYLVVSDCGQKVPSAYAGRRRDVIISETVFKRRWRHDSTLGRVGGDPNESGLRFNSDLHTRHRWDILHCWSIKDNNKYYYIIRQNIIFRDTSQRLLRGRIKQFVQTNERIWACWQFISTCVFIMAYL